MVSKIPGLYCRKKKDISAVSVLNFFQFLETQYSASTLWQAYSCISKYLLVNHNINIKNNELIKTFLKKKQKTHLPKKSLVLSREEVDRFLNLDSNTNVVDHNKCKPIILFKCVLVLGIYGLLRVSELVNLNFEDLVISKDSVDVKINQSKTDQAKKGFVFRILTPHVKYILCYVELFDIKDRSGRFFRTIGKNGKPTKAGMGKNTLSSIPSEVAFFLGLSEYENYTGHCFRRSGATILADSGVNKITLKRAGRWKSDSACDGYIEESKDSKIQIASAISGFSNVKQDSTSSVKNVYISGCNNLTLNL
jgi:integrase